MDKQLTIGQVAKRLGVSVDVVRSLTESGQLKAVRTGGRHRRYKPEEVERHHAKSRAAAPERQVERPTKKSRPIDRDLGEPEFEQDAPTLEELEAEEVRAMARQHSEAERPRLEGWTRYGRDLARWSLLPPDWHVRVVDDLEGFVTSKRFPPTLPAWEAQLMVQGRVNSIVQQYKDSEAKRQQKERDGAAERQRVEAERQQKERDAAAERRRVEDERLTHEREAAEQHRKQQEDERKMNALIDHGNSRAWSETIIGWDSEKETARRDVARALRDEVKADWTEGDVDDLVDDVLYEGDEDGEEEDDESS